jgi:uncharacterized protein (DUF58 family)
VTLESLLRYSQLYNFWQWKKRRHPPEHGRIVLVQRRIYILPTRHGVTFACALMLMLMGSINYNLSLGYVLTFLLAGMAIVSILHTFRNLAHLAIAAGKAEPVFAGEMARFTLHAENGRVDPRHAIVFMCEARNVTTGVPAAGSAMVELQVPAQRRGWLHLPRVTVETRYPLGLFRAWSYVQPAMRALVYPRPDSAPLPDPRPKPETGDAVDAGLGSDDFYGLREYQQTDSPRHIAWKAVARSDTMLTKSFSGRASRELLFDWDDLPSDLDDEARLSRLARWTLLAHAAGVAYGLRLPSVPVPVGLGDAQLARCLRALALHGSEGAREAEAHDAS